MTRKGKSGSKIIQYITRLFKYDFTIKNENIQIKEILNEAVLTNIHNPCFWAQIRKK